MKPTPKPSNIRPMINIAALTVAALRKVKLSTIMDFCCLKALVVAPVVKVDMIVKGRSQQSQYLVVVLAVVPGFGRGFHL